MPRQDDIAPRPRLELDAAVAAHRQLLIMLLTQLGQDDHMRRALVEMVDQRLAFHDADEDPGSEADPAFAFEQRVNGELRRILGDMQAALRATGKAA